MREVSIPRAVTEKICETSGADVGVGGRGALIWSHSPEISHLLNYGDASARMMARIKLFGAMVLGEWPD